MIRPFVVGRKSFLFCITETGAEVSAFLYSLVESCKAMDINVEDYLTWLFLNGNRVKDGDRNGWRKMLPGQSDISQGRIYRERLRTAKADSDRSEPYVLRGCVFAIGNQQKYQKNSALFPKPQFIFFSTI